jgi:N-methylhydantoinase A
MPWHVAADVGGTFTDVVAFDDEGNYASVKLPSTPRAFDAAVSDGIARLLRATGSQAADVERVAHGTTAGTNAILERKGFPTLLLTTKGFRDVLEIGRLRTPNSYDLFWTKPEPIVPRRLRAEVTERVASDGSVLCELDVAQADAAAARARAEGVRAVAVSFLNSFANPAHEQRVGALLTEKYPDLHVTLGTDLVSEPGEFERTSTAAINAYLQPVLSEYLRRLRDELDALGIGPKRLIMQSSGGMMNFDAAAQTPVHCVESGPAAGVLAARSVAEALELRGAISFDMGGTTAKAAVIENYQISFGHEFSVGSEISAMSRLLRSGGYTVRLPAIDLAEVGAGGGSVARIDAAGSLRVGPESAGAGPGPACYRRGGEHPTVTDANVVLGYISSEGLARGGIALDADAAARAIEREIAKPLGLSVSEAAYAIHGVADQQMARALRAVSTERGRDIRKYALIAFGGSGALHAATLAGSVGIRTVVIPPLAGYFSAIGLAYAPEQFSTVQPIRRALKDADTVRIVNRELEAMTLRLNGAVTAKTATVHKTMDLRYRGQAYELSIPVPERFDAASVEDVVRQFESLHRETYGHVPNATLDVIRLKVTVERPAPHVRLLENLNAQFEPASERGGVPVRTRAALGAGADGPLLIDDPDTTIVVPSDWHASVDGVMNVRLEKR